MDFLTLLFEIFFVNSKDELGFMSLDIEEHEFISWSFESLSRKDFTVVAVHKHHGVFLNSDSLGLR